MKRNVLPLSLFLLLPFFLFSSNTNFFVASSAGTMDLTPQFICDGDSAFPQHNGDETLDPSDILKFVIHDNSGTTLGNMFGGQGDVSTAYGVFPGMTTNTTYYISAIAGMDDGTGKVDLTDPELSVAQGTPVTFTDPIIINSNGGTLLSCSSTTAVVPINVQGGTPPYTYDWSDGSTNVILITTAAGQYDVTVTDANGCTASISVLVVQDINIPTVFINTPTTITCNNPCVILEGVATSQGGGGNLFYEWMDNNGVSISGTPVFTACIPGVYTLVVTDTNNGCSSLASVVVSEDLVLPIADAGPDLLLDCTSTTGVLDGLGSATGASISYQWTTINGNIVSGESTLTPLVDAVGTYELIVTDNDNGCTATDEVEVLGLGALAVDLGDDTYFDCNGSEMTLVGNNIPTGTGFTYQWDTNNGTITGGATTVSATISTPGTYFLTVEDPINNCIGMDEITVYELGDIIQVNPNMNLNCITNNPNVLEASIILLNNLNLSYEWTTMDGDFFGATNILNAIANGEGTYTLTVTDDATGCTATASILMGGYVFPTPLIIAPDGLVLNCDQSSLTLDATSSTGTGPLGYQWRLNGGFPFANDGVIAIDAPGEYIVLVQDLLNDCLHEDTVVVVEDFEMPSFNLPDTVYLNCNNNFTQEVGPMIVNPLGNETYSWVGPNNFLSTDSSIILSGNTSGFFEITVGNSVSGCSMVNGFEVVANPFDYDISTTVADCDQQNGTATISTTLPNSLIEWSTGEQGGMISNLAQGGYSVTVTDLDNNCNLHENFYIDEDISCKVVISGYVVNDPNNTCTYDATMEGIECVMVKLEPLGIFTLTDSTGYYEFVVDDGTYSVEYVGSPEVDLQCPTPGVYDVTLTMNGTVSDDNHFYVIRKNVDLCISKNTGLARRGLPQFNCVQICNYGENPEDAIVTFMHDSIFSDQSPWPNISPAFGNSIAPTYTYDDANNTFTWTLADLQPGECRKIMWYMTVPLSAATGDILTSSAKVNPIVNDQNPDNNCLDWTLEITGSFDPNDKRNFVGESVWGGAIYEDDVTMEYSIRFQNVGNDTAFTVVVRDTLDSEHLDVTTIRAFNSSHDMQVEFEDENILIFRFENIMLVDSMTNEPESNGFLSFTIDRKPNQSFGTEIENQASIYFDFNDPIITNEVVNVLTEPVSIFSPDKNQIRIEVFPNITSDIVNVNYLLEKTTSTSIQLFNSVGVLLQDFDLGKKIDGEHQHILDLKNYSAGVYFILVKTEEGSAVRKVVKK